MSLVRVLEVEEDVLHFSGVDLVRATPVPDIKPYVPDDCVASEAVTYGWLDALD